MCDYSRKPVKWQVGNFSSFTRIHEISLTVTKILIIYESAKYAFTGNH